jgi:hypothetical protein
MLHLSRHLALHLVVSWMQANLKLPFFRIFGSKEVTVFRFVENTL